jgi:DNA-binding transcriptional LysR family regulator
MPNATPPRPKISLPRLSMRKIACFVATADAGTVSAAAKQLSMSQARLSETLIDLERDIGMDLFVRHKARGVTLTHSGQQLLAEARDLIRHAEAFESLARQPNADLTGSIAIGSFPTLLPFVGPPLVAGFHSLHPGIDLHFVENSQTELERALLEGSIEVAILYDADLTSGIDKRILFESTPYVLLSKDHHLAQSADPIALAELAEEPLILMEAMPGKPDFVFSYAGVTPRPIHRTTNFELVRSLVARNVGYAVLVQRPVTNVTYEGLPLVMRPLADKIPPLRVILAWSTAVHLHQRVQALLNYGEKLFSRTLPYPEGEK